jgi:hypothetical protein
MLESSRATYPFPTSLAKSAIIEFKTLQAEPIFHLIDIREVVSLKY